jgi:hypothetical protein
MQRGMGLAIDAAHPVDWKGPSAGKVEIQVRRAA